MVLLLLCPTATHRGVPRDDQSFDGDDGDVHGDLGELLLVSLGLGVAFEGEFLLVVERLEGGARVSVRRPLVARLAAAATRSTLEALTSAFSSASTFSAASSTAAISAASSGASLFSSTRAAVNLLSWSVIFSRKESSPEATKPAHRVLTLDQLVDHLLGRGRWATLASLFVTACLMPPRARNTLIAMATTIATTTAKPTMNFLDMLRLLKAFIATLGR